MCMDVVIPTGCQLFMEEIVVHVTANLSRHRPGLCCSHPLAAEHTWPSPCNRGGCRQVQLGTGN